MSEIGGLAEMAKYLALTHEADCKLAIGALVGEIILSGSGFPRSIPDMDAYYISVAAEIGCDDVGGAKIAFGGGGNTEPEALCTFDCRSQR